MRVWLRQDWPQEAQLYAGTHGLGHGLRQSASEEANMILRSSQYLRNSFLPDGSADYVQKIAECIRPLGVDVIVVTGLSGVLLGTRVAAMLGCRLAVVRKEVTEHASYSVEGWLGGRWIFFDDLIDSGATLRNAVSRYAIAMREADQTGQYLGVFLHLSMQFIPDRGNEYAC
jgi:hypothetical protein